VTALALMLATVARVPIDERDRFAANIVAAATRYSASALGPILVSAAHFIAALIFLRTLPRWAFGQFSFVLVAVPFAMSMCGAMFGAPVARAIRAGGISDADTLTFLKANATFSALAGLVIAGLMAATGARVGLAAVFGAYGAAMTLRWFARSYAYANGWPYRTLWSDVVYSLLVVGGLGALLALHLLWVRTGSAMLLASAVAAFATFGTTYVRNLLKSIFTGRLAAYLTTWRELSRWSLAGVLMSEMTMNAHAYLVTFICGPKAFAVLALGSLLMRPVSLVLAALPDVERPLMARKIAAGGPAAAFRIVKEFRTAAGAIWLATVLLSIGLLKWFPHLIVKNGYEANEVFVVAAIAAAVMAVRCLRTPESVLMQAAGEFRKLAGAGVWAAAASLIATLVLLIAVGPIAAMGGILIGELIVMGRVLVLVKAWRAQYE